MGKLRKALDKLVKEGKLVKVGNKYYPAEKMP